MQGILMFVVRGRGFESWYFISAGVFFRKVSQTWSSHNAVHVEYGLTHTHTRCQYTRQKALELHLVGWVKNTERSTVVGVVQGEERQVEAM